MPLAADAAPRGSSFKAPHALVAAGFFVWAFFSLLPALSSRGEAFRVREAWDTGAFWTIGVPVLLIVQGVAGARDDARVFRDPLFTLGGLFAAMLLVHPAGNDLGLLPLALIFVGVPSYVGLLAAEAVGWGAGRLTGG
jgi:hypothetical protein